MIVAQIAGDLKCTKVELRKPKLDKEYDFILRYSNIVNTKLLKLLSSTSRAKGKFFKINGPRGVQSPNKSLQNFRFPNYNIVCNNWYYCGKKVLHCVDFVL